MGIVDNMRATKEQFEAYVQVKDSGLVNMWDVATVINLALGFHLVKISRDQCLDIMHNFGEYEKEYSDE